MSSASEIDKPPVSISGEDGFPEDAVSWISGQLEKLGLQPRRPMEQVLSSLRSFIFKIPTDAGNICFKAVSSNGSYEILVAQFLYQQYPDFFPQVLSSHVEKSWMLTLEEAGTDTLDKIPDIDTWCSALELYSQVQVEMTNRFNTLAYFGCPDRRIEKIIIQMEYMLADTAAMQSEQEDGLSGDEINLLQRSAPLLREKMEELARYRIPPTLEHGNLTPEQIVVKDNRFIFPDWSHASISHPFFSMSYFMDPGDLVQYFKTPAEDFCEKLRDAYLHPWTSYATQDYLEEAFELAKTLAPLHTALVYYTTVVPAFQNQSEIQSNLPGLLKKVIRHIKK